MDVTTACELFISDDTKKLACVQLRAPLAPALLDSFFGDLAKFLQTQNVAELIIFTSSFAHEQHIVDAPKILHLSSVSFQQRRSALIEDAERWPSWQHSDGNSIHGGGFALKLWQHFDALHVPVCLLFKYVNEGDNRTDALEVLDRIDQLLEHRVLATNNSGTAVRVKVPVSWMALYGNDPTSQLY